MVWHTGYDSSTLVLWYSFSCCPRFNCPDKGAIAPENEARHKTARMRYFLLDDQFYYQLAIVQGLGMRGWGTRGSFGSELGCGTNQTSGVRSGGIIDSSGFLMLSLILAPWLIDRGMTISKERPEGLRKLVDRGSRARLTCTVTRSRLDLYGMDHPCLFTTVRR